MVEIGQFTAKKLHFQFVITSLTNKLFATFQEKLEKCHSEKKKYLTLYFRTTK